MKYAITYALDDTWESVDTLLVETDNYIFDMSHEEIADIFDTYAYLGRERALALAKDESYWFVRSVEDTDVDNTTGEGE